MPQTKTETQTNAPTKLKLTREVSIAPEQLTLTDVIALQPAVVPLINEAKELSRVRPRVNPVDAWNGKGRFEGNGYQARLSTLIGENCQISDGMIDTKEAFTLVADTIMDTLKGKR